MIGRRLTTAVTLGVTCLVVALMAIWGYHQAAKPFPARGASAGSSCSAAEITKQVYVRRADVTVSVFNAGARKGFAALTLQRLEARGFAAGAIGNAPAGLTVKKVAVYTTTAHDTAAALVARNLGAQVRVTVSSQDLGPGIDVIVGPQMKGLAAHAPARLKLPKPVLTCVPVN